jgi:hypothetical protein
VSQESDLACSTLDGQLRPLRSKFVNTGIGHPGVLEVERFQAGETTQVLQTGVRDIRACEKQASQIG